MSRDVDGSGPLAPGLATTDPALAKVRKFATLFDTYMVDPILGFILPGAGDIVGSVMGLYVVVLAARRKVAPIVIARMLLNLAIDAGVGIVPFLGDIVDLGFKANTKNLDLLESRSAVGGRSTSWRDYAAVGGALLLLIGVLAVVVYVITWAFKAIT
ncbi:MAG: DUF4112 domain-containing protein [Deltaproteobacteria bacterium]|nr:DUF4112 domain-containing protein [Deltaproteobacteria bacterium]